MTLTGFRRPSEQKNFNEYEERKCAKNIKSWCFVKESLDLFIFTVLIFNNARNFRKNNVKLNKFDSFQFR